MDDKPFSPSSARNRDPILSILREAFADRRRVLEIGSGTGQHAAYFAKRLTHLQWQSSDVIENHEGIVAWLSDAALPNAPAPLVLDVNQARWPAGPFDAVFSANTLHIMGWSEVETMFRRLPEVLTHDAVVAIYGPFNYGGKFTSDSNAAFDQRLKGDHPRRGIRDFEAVDALARAAGLSLEQDHAMPANNRCLVWRSRVRIIAPRA
jgi:cyclopropane fatty-acyl-phospholipid synthase-like methyltransferase